MIIDIEEVFSDFVEEHGGIVSDRVPSKGNKPSNADYIFHEGKVIVELKLLKEDPSKIGIGSNPFRRSNENGCKLATYR